MSARATIAIVSYNSGATLPRCLAALAAQSDQNFRVILIDNASRERPATLLAGLPFAVDYREMGKNLGFAGAMSLALEVCDTLFLLALNPDAYPAPDWLASLVAAADKYPDIAAFGSLQRRADDPEVIDGFGDHYLIFGQAWRGATMPALRGRDVAYCFGVCAAAALYRADALRAVGGFDDRLFCFYEDVDVSFRLRLAGAQIAVIPAAVVDHVGGASFEGLSDFAAFLIARNQWWVLVKNMPLALLPAALAGFILLQLVGFVRHPGSARMKGLWAGLRRTGDFIASRREVQRRRKIGAAELGGWLSWNPGAFLTRTTLIRR